MDECLYEIQRTVLLACIDLSLSLFGNNFIGQLALYVNAKINNMESMPLTKQC